MELEIDLENMKEVFGEEILESISFNMDSIKENIELLKKLKFDDIGGLFERCPDIFMDFPSNFESKINNLIKELGSEYVEIIENDISYIENL